MYQLLPTVNLSVWCILLTFLCCTSVANATTADSGTDWSFTSDADWAEYAFSDYLVSNNVWGKESLRAYSQSIFFDSSILAFGWDWDWPYNPYQVRGYPEVIYGKKPWSVSSTVADLPCGIADVNLQVEFTLKTEAIGVYNTAFDIWLTSSKEAGPNDILYEIMVWIDNHGMTPLGSVLDVVELDGVRYRVYVAKGVGEQRWTYICFRADKTFLSGKIDLEAFMQYLVTSGLVDNDVYLADIEFGNEIIWGKGKTVVSTYKISRKGVKPTN